jgi:hypothetical protein
MLGRQWKPDYSSRSTTYLERPVVTSATTIQAVLGWSGRCGNTEEALKLSLGPGREGFQEEGITDLNPRTYRGHPGDEA